MSDCANKTGLKSKSKYPARLRGKQRIAQHYPSSVPPSSSSVSENDNDGGSATTTVTTTTATTTTTTPPRGTLPFRVGFTPCRYHDWISSFHAIPDTTIAEDDPDLQAFLGGGGSGGDLEGESSPVVEPESDPTMPPSLKRHRGERRQQQRTRTPSSHPVRMPIHVWERAAGVVYGINFFAAAINENETYVRPCMDPFFCGATSPLTMGDVTIVCPEHAVTRHTMESLWYALQSIGLQVVPPTQTEYQLFSVDAVAVHLSRRLFARFDIRPLAQISSPSRTSIDESEEESPATSRNSCMWIELPGSNDASQGWLKGGIADIIAVPVASRIDQRSAIEVITAKKHESENKTQEPNAAYVRRSSFVLFDRRRLLAWVLDMVKDAHVVGGTGDPLYAIRAFPRGERNADNHHRSHEERRFHPPPRRSNSRMAESRRTASADAFQSFTLISIVDAWPHAGIGTIGAPCGVHVLC